MRRRRPVGLHVAALLLAAGLGACAPGAEPGPDGSAATGGADGAPFTIPIEWLADSARAAPLRVEPPPEVWIARVTPARPAPPDPPLPEAMPSVPEEAPPPPALEVDPGLKPPIPRRTRCVAAPVRAPRPAYVELDVEVGAGGDVMEVAWAGGARDPALVDAAIECARAMTFFPAMRGDQPVAVWCRQRFDFGR